MPDILDERYLELEQYKDASHLNARIQLHQRFSTNRYGWFRWVFDQFNLPPEANILEIGCGPGTLWLENKHRIPPDWRITLSDFSPGMTKEAKRNLGFIRTTFHYEVSNGMAIPFPKETFHAIIANHVLFHFPDRQRALAEVCRLLKPDGWFYASTNGKNHLMELSQIINSYSRLGSKYYSPAFSEGEFTLESGMQLLTPWFEQIVIRHYADALVITEAEPLVAYILSLIPRADIDPDDRFITSLFLSINEKIKQHGSIYIQKSTGMFIGKKGMHDK